MIGIVQVLTGKEEWDFSAKVTSKSDTFILYISSKNFFDRLMIPFPDLRESLETETEDKVKYLGKLKKVATNFFNEK